MGCLKIVNIVLAAFAVLLALNLLMPLGPLAGNAVYALDASEPECHFNTAAGLREIPSDACCFELRQQLACTRAGTDIRCYTSESSGTYYLVNSKLLALCNLEGFNVKVS